MTTLTNKYNCLSLIALSVAMAGCVGTAKNTTTTETLGSFAELEIKQRVSSDQNTEALTHQLSKQERTEKLNSIYRSILTLEPDSTVRAQIQHRMVQLDIEKYEQSDVLESKETLLELAAKYEGLLKAYPERAENENILYHLAKTYDMLAQPKKSIGVLESLLEQYPNTEHYAELQFRRAELYYNVEQYPLAYKAYKAVLTANNNEKYRLNSLYMSGWALFKLNRLTEADDAFFNVLQYIALSNKLALANKSEAGLSEEQQLNGFTFDNVPASQKSLAEDTQRVLSISLSQQQQSVSLIALLNRQKQAINPLSDQINKNPNPEIAHILFENLALFLIEKGLVHDAVLTYENYLDYAPHDFWSAKFSLALIELYQQKNQFVKIRNIKKRFVNFYGIDSVFWKASNQHEISYALPYLSDYSLSQGLYLYNKSQNIENDEQRAVAFKNTAEWLDKYLNIIEFSNNNSPQKAYLAIQENFLFAEASFEAQQYKEALNTYKLLAYSPGYLNEKISEKASEKNKQITKNTSSESISVIGDQNIYSSNPLIEDPLSPDYINLESGYATIITVAELISSFENSFQAGSHNTNKEQFLRSNIQYQQLIEERSNLNNLFIAHYGDDKRAKLIAIKAVEYAFNQNNVDDVIYYTDFVLKAYKADSTSIEQSNNKKPPKLDSIALKQVAIASKIKANIRYKFKQYEQAEKDYLLALHYEADKVKKQELNELIASSIYEQGKAVQALNTPADIELAINHYLRLGKVVPNSTYRVNAEFDAANLLIATKQWRRAIPVLTQFKREFSTHAYALTIPAKLALSYENLEDWSKAAEQLLLMAKTEKNIDLKRESQYTAAEYFLKAGDTQNAIINFRTYAHQFPEPFNVAQEVRFKMSEFYRETNEPNKRYFWYRKLISFHKKQEAALTNLPIANLDLERSTYLASYAAFNLGKAHQQTFKQTKLKIPLNKSLQRKQQSMKQAINYYYLVFKWQLAEFVPQANYLIGQLYRDLAVDVMKSQRPNDLDALALEEYEFLLEEIAYPFEEKAIEVHKANAERAWDNVYDEWVKNSLAVLAEIEPAKYNKFETVPEVFDEEF